MKLSTANYMNEVLITDASLESLLFLRCNYNATPEFGWGNGVNASRWLVDAMQSNLSSDCKTWVLTLISSGFWFQRKEGKLPMKEKLVWGCYRESFGESIEEVLTANLMSHFDYLPNPLSSVQWPPSMLQPLVVLQCVHTTPLVNRLAFTTLPAHRAMSNPIYAKTHNHLSYTPVLWVLWLPKHTLKDPNPTTPNKGRVT